MTTTTDDHGLGTEEQVAVLVELFASTRSKLLRPPSQRQLSEWSGTFRLMLGHLGIPFDDIKLVVTALGDKRLWLDFGRYGAPYFLVHNGEWPHVLASVKIALLGEHTFPTPPPRRSRFDDDDYSPRRPGAVTSGSSDMSNVAERRRRYAARAARS